MTLTAPLSRALRRWRGPVDDLLGPIPRPPWASAGNLRDVLARQWIHGRGIEIGPLCCPLFVPRDAHVTYLDKWNEAALRDLGPHPRLAAQLAGPSPGRARTWLAESLGVSLAAAKSAAEASRRNSPCPATSKV